MKKLLFIFTGGTIGSTLKGNYISTDSKKPYILIDGYEKQYGKIENYKTISPYTMLSENMDEEYIIKLVHTVYSNIDKYDGIIVTHGTDTLAYSSAALGYALGKCKIPVCVVSANYPLEDERSNGYANLHGAVRFIEDVGIGGVWVSYKNENQPLQIHNGTRLTGHIPFSDRVSSVKNSYFGSFSENWAFKPNCNYNELKDELSPMLSSVNTPLDELIKKANKGFSKVLRIAPYPGMNYPGIPEGTEYIIHESYHSGTINTRTDKAKSFYKNAREKKIPIYITGVENRASYESTKMYKDLGIIPLYDISPIAALVKIQLLCTFGLDVEREIFKVLSGDR